MKCFAKVFSLLNFVSYSIDVQILEGYTFKAFYGRLSICKIILEVSMANLWFASIGEQDGIGYIHMDGYTYK